MLSAFISMLQCVSAGYTSFEGYARGTEVSLTYFGPGVPDKTYTYSSLSPGSYPEWQGKQSGHDLNIFSGIIHGNVTFEKLPSQYHQDQDVTFNGTIVDGVIDRTYYNSEGFILGLSDKDVAGSTAAPGYLYTCYGLHHRPSGTCIVAGVGN